MKIYYNEQGWVCERYPYDIPKTDNYIEVNEEIYQQTLSCDEGFSWKIVNGKLEKQIYDTNIVEIRLIELELYELEQWFETYDLQVKQYERATRLGETFDKDIKMLDNEAREKASRVKELRKLLEGLK